jgi:hypothetical protein
MKSKMKEIKSKNFIRLENNFSAVVTKMKLYWMLKEAYDFGKKNGKYSGFKKKEEELIEKVRREEIKRLENEHYNLLKCIRNRRTK